MDIIDQAQQREELERELAIRQHACHESALPAVGACHYCSATVPAGSRFCDRDCMADWQKEQDARKRSGWMA